MSNGADTKITAIKAIRLREGFSLIRIDTDAGISGYGECGSGDGELVRSAIAAFFSGGRLPHLGLLGKNPLDIAVHHHNMFRAYAQRQRYIQVLSGIDMALWDLAGKLLDQPVARLLGGIFRSEIECYSHCPSGDFLDAGAWAERAAMLREDPRGFTAYKVDLHHVLNLPMQQTATSLGPQDIRKVHRAYVMAREALGDDIDIIVHCHCELDTPSAIQVARAVEVIEPLYFEDPLQPGFGEHWMALRRSTRVPLMTGENQELAEGALPFLQNQAVDILQPDIVNSGGITGTKAIADLAGLYRTPVALHNVSGLLLNMASQQLAASIFNCPRIECSVRATGLQWAAVNPIVIRNGKMQVSTAPGLGVELDPDYLRGNLVEGEPWWD